LNAGAYLKATGLNIRPNLELIVSKIYV